MPQKLVVALIPPLAALIDILTNRDGQKNAERTALVAFIIRVGSAALAFISQIFLARMMGEFNYGIFVFVWVFVVMAGNLSCLGFHTAVIKLIPQYRAAGEYSLVRGLNIASRILVLLMATTIALLGVGAIFLFKDTIPDYYLVPIILGACAVPMISLGDTLDGTGRANSWPIAALTPTFIIRPMLIVIFVIGAILLGYDKNATTALICAIGATYLTTFGQYIFITSKIKKTYDKEIADSGEVAQNNKSQNNKRWDIKNWFAVALPIFVIESFYYLLTNSDVLIVGLYLSPERVAIYFAAAKSMALVHFIYFAVKASSGPKFAELSAGGDMEKLNAAAQQTARWTLYPTLAIGLTVLLLGQLILSMFGSAFIEGHMVMIILFGGILAKAIIGPGEVLLTMIGRQKICALIYATALGANIALNVTLIPAYGLNGAAAATSMAMVFEALLLFTIIKWKTGISMSAFSSSLHSSKDAQVNSDVGTK